MTVQLSDTAIFNEILALTALRTVVAPREAEAPVPLTRDALPGLRNLLRLNFAETVMELMPYVTDCNLDDGDPVVEGVYQTDSSRPSDHLTLSVDLRLGGNIAPGIALTVRRTVEHVVAAKVIESVMAGADPEFASQIGAQHAAAMASLSEVLAANDTFDSIPIKPHWC